nr:MAG TPA: hypothetical protein [Caudoviricetes sp.]
MLPCLLQFCVAHADKYARRASVQVHAPIRHIASQCPRLILRDKTVRQCRFVQFVRHHAPVIQVPCGFPSRFCETAPLLFPCVCVHLLHDVQRVIGRADDVLRAADLQPYHCLVFRPHDLRHRSVHPRVGLYLITHGNLVYALITALAGHQRFPGKTDILPYHVARAHFRTCPSIPFVRLPHFFYDAYLLHKQAASRSRQTGAFPGDG